MQLELDFSSFSLFPGPESMDPATEDIGDISESMFTETQEPDAVPPTLQVSLECVYAPHGP